MAANSKPTEPSDFDKIVSAEIPDPVSNPNLHTIVTRNMIHGPCGLINPASPCMDSNVCGKNFPKEFQNHTTMQSAMYPEYRRRSPENGGRTHQMKVRGQDFIADNRWIVPYSPFLSLKYNAHINVEIVISVSCVKYLYKYTCKGSDRVMVNLANGKQIDITNDEVERFVNARYVSSSEAYWRLYEFKILNKYPPVAKLPLHLQDEQTVLFRPEQALQVASQPPPVTKLTAFFQLNNDNPEARQILYPDVYRHYTWNKNKWVRRSRHIQKHVDGLEHDSFSDMLGRIPVINLNAQQSELYFLRMLLYHIPGPRSFEHLRTVDNKVLPTFQAACLKLGILDDDAEIDQIMEEAASVRFGSQLREVFATILI